VRVGTENRNKALWAVGLGVLAILAVAYEVIPMFSGPSTTSLANSTPVPVAVARPAAQHRGAGPGKKGHSPVENLDPTLQLQLLATTEQIKYAGSGRNIFVSQPDPVIPKPGAPGYTDTTSPIYVPPQPPAPPAIPLKFFGFANQPGEPRKIFLSKGEDVFIAGEGDIVDRRYKVVRISPNSVEIQDVVSSGPTQHIPLTQG
jgi:hypothetical protein